MARWHRNGSLGIVTFAVTPAFDIEIQRQVSGVQGVIFTAYAVNTSTRRYEVIATRKLQRDAKAAAAEWAEAAKADYREAVRARLDGALIADVSAEAYNVRRAWDARCMVAQRADALEDAHSAAHTEAAERQIAAWQERHADTPRRNAYWMIDARDADLEEALKMNREIEWHLTPDRPVLEPTAS